MQRCANVHQDTDPHYLQQLFKKKTEKERERETEREVISSFVIRATITILAIFLSSSTWAIWPEMLQTKESAWHKQKILDPNGKLW